LQSEDTPGLAMTRSMGDIVSKKIGVIAEPCKFYNKRNFKKYIKRLINDSFSIWWCLG